MMRFTRFAGSRGASWLWPPGGAAAAILLALLVTACGGQADGGSPAASAAAVASAPSVVSSSAAAPATPAAAVTTASLSRVFPAATGPLDLRVTRTGRWDGARVRHVTYRSDGAVVTGVLSVPAGEGPFPAVLYAPGVSCRAEMFADDVAALQRDGLAALVIDPPDGRDPHVAPVSLEPKVVVAAHVRYVTDLRRGLDVLESLPKIDPDRIGYVGYSWGGFVGGYLAGLRTPVQAFVLTYAGADWVGTDPTQVAGFVDPAAAVSAGRRGAYLFVGGVDDPLFSRASVTRYANAARGRMRLDWFPGGHGDLWAMPEGAAVEAHRAWLQDNL
jgi:dienelactone hydrolase